MPDPDFHIEISDQEVSVRLDASTKSPHGRFYACLFRFALAASGMCAVLFHRGKLGYPSLWHDLSVNPLNPWRLIVLLILLLMFSLFLRLIPLRRVTLAYPSDEIFRCNRSTLTISKVRWFDPHNQDWQSRSYPLTEIADVRYKRIVLSQNSRPYGLHFSAAGKNQVVLPYLDADQADRILKALTALGVDVWSREG